MFGNKPGQRIIEVAETDSTNSYAARLLHEEIPEEGTVIFSSFQKAGRGQRGSNWESEAGKNMLLSYILYPVFLPVSNHFSLNQAISLALQETLQQFTIEEIKIKWPNDILAGNEKIAGILIENTIRNVKLIHAIAGAGININQLQFENYQPPATSLAKLENKTFVTATILKVLNHHIDKWYSLLRVGNYAKINEAFLSKLFQYNQPARYESSGIRFNGTITGIASDGRLKILREDGTDVVFANKEVKFLY